MSDSPADLEFFFDPVCPWAYITSRWVVEVQQLREYSVNWRFISLKMLNEHRTDADYTPRYRGVHLAGLHGLRVADAVRLDLGDPAVGAFYTALGDLIHRQDRRSELTDHPIEVLGQILTSVGYPAALAQAALDEGHDQYIRAETELALSRTGPDVGTPILTFRPGRPDTGSFFGPVIANIPRGDQAVKLWDAIETIATSAGVCELKRSNRVAPTFD